MMPPQRRTAVLVAASATRNPSGGYQQPLSNSERKSKRGEAQRLGRELVTVNLGKNGLTPAFLDGFRTALTSNELIKVRVGSCDESVDEVAEALTAVGDCVLVHKIGFTLTFFREKGLPPPRPVKRSRVAQPAAAAAAAPAAAAAAGAAAALAAAEAAGQQQQAAAAAAPGAAAPGGAGVAAAAAAGEDSGDEESEGEEGSEDELLDAEMAAYLMENEDAFSDSDSEGEEAEEAAGGTSYRYVLDYGSGGEEEEDKEDKPNSSKRQAAAAKAAKALRAPPPPEFTIIK
ncbi:hypothetical protein D9Q98_007107 [Chlorella vulgaris]|uniref:CRM domain-containing protein n=1 Tax=Chlorella vulgaris TaxID=3077 RepID=A0A9D4TJF6_CHLVU|nr:hypothetical protein D9Q98_007107 [Chlorella vulgaris]